MWQTWKWVIFAAGFAALFLIAYVVGRLNNNPPLEKNDERQEEL